MFCSNRGRRGGCGRSFAIFFTRVLPRHSLDAALWSGLMQALVAGSAIKSAWENLRTGFSLESAYGLVRRTRGRLAWLRPLCCRFAPPPPSAHTDPLPQTIAHLRLVLNGATDLAAAFQGRFQQPLLG